MLILMGLCILGWALVNFFTACLNGRRRREMEGNRVMLIKNKLTLC